jgi:uncharacterized membrane protein YkoI
MFTTRKKLVGAVAGALLLGGAAAALASGAVGPSRMDDGKDLQSQAKITEAQAIAAAQTKASGSLNEVDLEHAGGKLVYNVDVGSHDVKVDAITGDVVSVDQDD